MDIAESRYQAINQFIKNHNLEKKCPDIGKGIYLSYPDFFYSAIFKREVDFDNEYLTQFCLASFLMYQFLIELDDVIDEVEGELNSKSLGYILRKQNLSHQLLSGLFEFNSEFWDLYEQRQNYFIDGVFFETKIVDYKYKEDHYKNQLNLEFYRSYYAKKCSFSSLAIDGLYILSNKQCGEDNYDSILEINNRFNFAFCVLDDVEDYRKDIGKKQLNFAHHYFLSEQFKSTENIDCQLEKSVEFFYTKGFSLKIIELANKELLKAYEISQEIEPNGNLGMLLQLKITDLRTKLKIVREYAKK